MKLKMATMLNPIPVDEYLVYGDHSWEIRELLLNGRVSYSAPYNHKRYALEIIKEVGSKDIVVKYVVVDAKKLKSGEVELTAVGKYSPEEIIKLENIQGDAFFYYIAIKVNTKKL